MTEKLEVGAYEAKTHLADLLRQVREGSRFTITQRGQPVADLVPTGAAEAAEATQRSGAEAAQRMRQFMHRGSAPARTVAGKPSALTAADIKALIADGRD